MKIDYVARHFRLDDKTREYADKKLGKATKFLEEPIEIRVILDETKRHRVADIRASHRFGVLQATEETDSFKGATIRAHGTPASASARPEVGDPTPLARRAAPLR